MRLKEFKVTDPKPLMFYLHSDVIFSVIFTTLKINQTYYYWY